MASLPTPPKLTTITAPNGARFTVAAEYASQFQGMINDLAARGYVIDPNQSGGYNPRMIAGTNTPSEHAYGRAIDVNWSKNPQGSATSDIPPELAHEVANKWGMTWGGDWTGKTRDAMHFEIKAHPTDPSVPATVNPINLTGTPSVPNPVTGSTDASGFGLPGVGPAPNPDLVTVGSTANNPVNLAQMPTVSNPITGSADVPQVLDLPAPTAPVPAPAAPAAAPNTGGRIMPNVPSLGTMMTQTAQGWQNRLNQPFFGSPT